MTRSRKRKLQRSAAKWTGMPLASAVFACANVASAQQTASSGGEVVGLEEVIVTAQKRTEDLQKVPISLTVLGTEQLENHQVSNFDDFVKLLPSVSYQSLGPGQNQLYFRGIASGGDGLHAGSLPATGMYLDETPVTTIGGALDIHMYDIQRVEALAGPQGTLYGASSLSGTLRVITNKPDATKFSSAYDVQANKYGKGNGGGAFEGYVNVPLSDRAAVRLVAYYEHDGGYISNKLGTVNYYRAGSYGAAGRLSSPTDFIHQCRVGQGAISTPSTPMVAERPLSSISRTPGPFRRPTSTSTRRPTAPSSMIPRLAI